MVVTVGCGQQVTGKGNPGATIVSYKSVSGVLTSFVRGTYFAVFARLWIDWLITICTVTRSRHGGRLLAIHNRFGQTINGILDAAGPTVSKLFRFLRGSMSTISFKFKGHEVLTQFSGHCGSAGKQTRRQIPLSAIERDDTSLCCTSVSASQHFQQNGPTITGSCKSIRKDRHHRSRNSLPGPVHIGAHQESDSISLRTGA